MNFADLMNLTFRSEVKEILLLWLTIGEYSLKQVFNKKSAQGIDDKPETLVENIVSKYLSVSDKNYLSTVTILNFYMKNKTLINKFIQLNSSLINKQLI